MKRQLTTLRVLYVVAALVLSNCSDDTTPPPQPATSTTPDNNPLSDNPASTASTTPEAEAALDQLAPRLPDDLDPLITHCIATRAATELPADDPALTTLIDTCTAHTTLARTFATSTAGNQQLDQAQTDCLAVSYTELPPETTAAITHNALEPNTTNPETQQALTTLDELIDRCTH